MFLNLTQMRTEVGVRLKTPSTLSSGQKDLWLNLAQDDVANEMDPSNLMVTSSLVTSASQRKYYLDYQFGKISAVSDQTNNQEVYWISESDIELVDPNFTATGTSSHYTIYGLEFIRALNSIQGTVSIVSSSASDITQKVRISGKIGGSGDSELLTLNGVTPVAGSKSWDANTIYSVAKNDVTQGYITSTAAATDVISVIPKNSYVEEKMPLYLWPTPQSVITYRIRGYRQPHAMVNAEDYPDMPQLYHELVVIGAVIKGHRSLFRFKAADEIETQEWLPMIKRLKAQMGNRRSKTAPVIQGMPPIWYGGRYPSQYGR